MGLELQQSSGKLADSCLQSTVSVSYSRPKWALCAFASSNCTKQCITNNCIESHLCATLRQRWLAAEHVSITQGSSAVTCGANRCASKMRACARCAFLESAPLGIQYAYGGQAARSPHRCWAGARKPSDCVVSAIRGLGGVLIPVSVRWRGRAGRRWQRWRRRSARSGPRR